MPSMSPRPATHERPRECRADNGQRGPPPMGGRAGIGPPPRGGVTTGGGEL